MPPSHVLKCYSWLLVVLPLTLGQTAIGQRMLFPQAPILPAEPRANSQAYLRNNNMSHYSIHAGNRSSCRFKTSVIPCECLLEVSDQYVLEENGMPISNFTVKKPDIRIRVPTNHELLRDLTVFLQSKLCLADTFQLFVQRRPLEVLPDDIPVPWTTVHEEYISLHDFTTQILIPCQAFADVGYYRVLLRSRRNYSVEAETEILVNRSTESSLLLRNDSIFPHCTNKLDITWKIAKCPALAMHYRIRVLAIPEGEVDKERSLYIEEFGVERERTSLSLSCAQFDILYEKYCFELASVNRNSSVFHLWHSVCVSTEPVLRKDGGWSEWTSWSPCSATCGVAEQRRSRSCTNPPPTRGRSCRGSLVDIRKCTQSPCPETVKIVMSSQCDCGCELVNDAGSFFASASGLSTCDGNLTWSLGTRSQPSVVDFKVEADLNPIGKLFIFIGGPYQELVWFSGSNQEKTFTLSLDSPIFVVLWLRDNSSYSETSGYTVVYSVREADPPSQLPQRAIASCHPFCADTVVISFLAVVFLVVIFIPPFICASITQKIKRNRSPELPLLHRKFSSDMTRSGNTEVTQTSCRNGGAFVAKRSIGIQLSCQSTPKFSRLCVSESPCPYPRGLSSLSTSDELEYDYYDGTQLPGSFLAPLPDDEMCSEIDIDQIIGQSRIFLSNVETQDVHTQM